MISSWVRHQLLSQRHQPLSQRLQRSVNMLRCNQHTLKQLEKMIVTHSLLISIAICIIICVVIWARYQSPDLIILVDHSSCLFFTCFVLNRWFFRWFFSFNSFRSITEITFNHNIHWIAVPIYSFDFDYFTSFICLFQTHNINHKTFLLNGF